MDAAAAQALVRYLIDQRTVVDYMYITAFSLLYYDWFITLSEEIQLVWFARFNYTKVLFLLSRYLPMIDSFFILRTQVGLDVDWSLCGKYYAVSSWLLVLALMSSEVILCVRTWAVWNRNRVIGFLLAGLVVVSLSVGPVFADRFLKSLQIDPAPYPGYRGCFVTGASDIMYVNFIVLIVPDTVVLGLMCISAWKSYRHGSINELSLVVHRDGILFYLYILVFTIGNFVVMLAAPPVFEMMLAPLQATLYSIFSCRIVLNIRRTAKGTSEQLNAQLHTTHGDIHFNTVSFNLSEMNPTLDLADDDLA